MSTPALKFLILVSGAFFILTHVAANPERSPKVLALDFTNHVSRRAPNSHRLRSRQNTVAADLGNYEKTLYIINITIGTPPQSFSVQLDTGASDTWVPSSDSDACPQDSPDCQTFGEFDETQSSTFVPVGPQGQSAFNVSYEDNSAAFGDYFNDTLRIGETVINNMTMGLALQGDTPFDTLFGVLGIGYDFEESIVGDDPDDIYPNFLDQLVSQGYINTLAYSLWLNDLNANTGSIVFGGVDTSKFHGDLVVLPIQPTQTPTSSLYTDFIVALSTVTFTDATGKIAMSQSNLALPVSLDSNYSASYLPQSVLDPILSGLGAFNDEELGGLIIPCSQACSSTALNFGFGGDGGPSIAVPLAELILPIIYKDGTHPAFSNGEPICSFGIAAGDPGPYLLGNTFLRSAYVVYDLTHDQIAIAQTKFNATSSNIEEISDHGIPGASSTALGPTVLQTNLGYARTNLPAARTETAQIITSIPSPTFRLGSCSSSSSSRGSSSVSQTSSSPSSSISGTGSSGSGKSPAVVVVPPMVGAMTVVSGLVCLVSIVFGGSLVILM